MSSSVREITVNDRLRLLHDFYRPGEEQLFRFNFEDTIRRGHDFRDCIAPDCISFQKITMSWAIMWAVPCSCGNMPALFPTR